MEILLENDIEKTRKEADKRLLWVSALFGVLFSALFTNQNPGLNFLLFVLAVYAAGGLTLKDYIQKGFKENAFAYLLTLPVLLLSLCCFLYSGSLTFLDFLIVPVLLWAQLMLLTRRNAHDWFDIRFAMDFVMSVVMRLIGCCYKFFLHAFYFFFPGKKEKSSAGGKVLFGVLAGLALLFIILPLLLSADQNMQNELRFFFMFIDFGDVFLYIFFFLFAASLCFGFIWSLKNDKPAYSVKIPASQKRPLPPQSVAAALLVVCIVYVFFAAVQFKYLFSSYNTLMQTPGLTSAAYAVRGFAELIVITLINFALLGLSMNFTRPEGKQVFLKILYFILILFNFVILYSSHLRLSLYEHSFGFTVARFLPHLFLIFFALLNIVMLVKSFIPHMRAFKCMLIVFLVFYTCINFIGLDRTVANLNISRYDTRQQNAVQPDTAHLLTLSDDAMPAVADFMAREIGNDKLFTIVKKDNNAPEFQDDDSRIQITVAGNKIWIGYISLDERISRYKEMNSRWPALNISRLQAQAAYEKIGQIIQNSFQ